MVYSIKIKKFIIYSIYNADMQTLYKKTLILNHSCMSAFVCKGKISMSVSKTKCRHADIKIYNFAIVTAILTVFIILCYQIQQYKLQIPFLTVF